MKIQTLAKNSRRGLFLLLMTLLVSAMAGLGTARADDIPYIISMAQASSRIRTEVFEIVKAAVRQTAEYAAAPEVRQAISEKNIEKLTGLANYYVWKTTYVDVVAFFDEKGDMLAMNTSDHEGQAIPEEALRKITQKSFSEVPVISDCLKNMTNRTVLEFQRRCDFTPALYGSSGLSVAISSAVKDSEDGSKKGVVSTRLNFQRILGAINASQEEHPGIKVYLIDGAGNYYDEAINADGAKAPMAPEELGTYLRKFAGGGDTQNIFADEPAFHLQIMKLAFEDELFQKDLYLLVFAEK